MLERLISDIAKWLVIILIFFFAFACSLFLIFSYFAVSLQYRQVADETPTLSSLFYRNLSTSVPSDARCPPKFFHLTNYSVVDVPTGSGGLFSVTEEENFCMRTEHYDKIKDVGPYPAVSYFGESFGATILTIFFTLFGVIAEDNVPVRSDSLVSREIVRRIRLGSRIRVDHVDVFETGSEELQSWFRSVHLELRFRHLRTLLIHLPDGFNQHPHRHDGRNDRYDR